MKEKILCFTQTKFCEFNYKLGIENEKAFWFNLILLKKINAIIKFLLLKQLYSIIIFNEYYEIKFFLNIFPKINQKAISYFL